MPPVSIMNAVEFETVDAPGITMVADRGTSQSMRWMYMFLQVGIRLTLDNRLPSVGYQIKMQYVMNCCFWLLCGLVLESNVVFFLVRKRGWDEDITDRFDLAAACVALVYNAYIIMTYFRGKRSTPHVN